MLDKQPRNKDKQPHGHWELYYFNNQLAYNGIYINGERYGYWEIYFYNGKLEYKEYYAR